MKKRVLSVLLCAVLTLSAMGFAIPMTTMADSMMVVTVGADLTEEEKAMILRYFNVAGQSYTTITVTNDDEWAHLGGYMSRDIVGYRTISCALIRPMTTGGIQVKTANLTYVTSNMIASNLATAGVTNCEVLAAAPFQVSGTGALTGALMAYENLSGVTLSEAKKQAAVQEFATTYELGKTVGQQEAQQIVNDVKMQVINGTLEEDNSVTYEEITEIVNNVVNNYTTNNTTNIANTGLTPDEVASLQQLAVEIAKESYDQGTIDALAQIQKTLEGQTQTTSSAATTQIEQNASPTINVVVDTQSSQGTESGTDTTSLSAADQALSQDSLLTNTDESALASTASDGSVISSSTAESTIDTSVSTNLDTQIEAQAAEKAQEAQAQPEAQPQETPSPSSDPAMTIPEPTDVTVLGGDSAPVEVPAEAPSPAPETPAEVSEPGIEAQADAAEPVPEAPVPEAQPGIETPEESAEPGMEAPSEVSEPVAETPAEVPEAAEEYPEEAAEPGLDYPEDVTDSGMETPENIDDTGMENPEEAAEPGDENPEENPEAAEGEEEDQENVISITADDIDDDSISFRVSSTADYGSQPASGISPVEVIVPYENLVPVSGALHVLAADSGAEVAYVNIEPSSNGLVLLTSDTSSDVPAGSTRILMVPKDGNDINLQTDYAPVEGQRYTYIFDAQFSMPDGELDIQIDNYDPYYGNPVSGKGFSVNGSCLNKSAGEGASGSVLFPSDGSAVYATVDADAADVSISSGMDGVMQGSGDVVEITPMQSGPVTLYITYYSQAPAEGEGADPAAEVGTAEYTIYFN